MTQEIRFRLEQLDDEIYIAWEDVRQFLEHELEMDEHQYEIISRAVERFQNIKW